MIVWNDTEIKIGANNIKQKGTMQLQGQHLYVLTESLASIPLSVSIIIFFY